MTDVLNSRNERNSSIELLRIMAMVGVVILHYNNGGIGGGFQYVEKGSLNSIYLYFSEALFICAVNLFIMISAYFLVSTNKRKPIKVLELIVQAIVFSLIFYTIGLFTGNTFSLKSLVTCFPKTYYFAILYSALYLISPYINLSINKLTKKQFSKFVLLLFFLFSVWTIGVDLLSQFGDVNAMSTVGIKGSQSGYTIVNFVLCYIIAAYIKKYDVTFNWKIKTILFVVCLAALFDTSLLSKITFHYNNPFVIAMAAIILIIFKDITFNSKIINELAKGAFTCFLLHEAFMKHLFIEQAVSFSLPLFILHQFGVAAALYLAAYIVYKVYHFLSNWFFAFIEPLMNKFDLYSFEEK